jgi:hypothetical protein
MTESSFSNKVSGSASQFTGANGVAAIKCTARANSFFPVPVSLKDWVAGSSPGTGRSTGEGQGELKAPPTLAGSVGVKSRIVTICYLSLACFWEDSDGQEPSSYAKARSG